VLMRGEIKELHQRLKTTTVYVTHDQVEAMTLADRIAVLRSGRLEQFATPNEIYNRPASLFVARFMGSPPMSVVPAQIAADGARIDLADGTSLPVPETQRRVAQAATGRPIEFAFARNMCALGKRASLATSRSTPLWRSSSPWAPRRSPGSPLAARA
jgi:multiple sugar transport system ATP-binding protein